MSDGIGLADLSGGTKWWGGEGCGIGDKISGIVIKASREQQTDFDTGKPLEWDNGDPRMESVVVLETDLRDPDVENDTGERALHLRGGNFTVDEGSGLAGEKALKKAMQEAKVTNLVPGCKVQAAITGYGAVTGRGRNAPKLWTLKITEPQEGIDEGDLFDD